MSTTFHHQHIRMRQRVFHATLVLVMAGSLLACEETVSPIVESHRQLTLYGVLDMNRDTQFVRVIPIRPSLVPQEDGGVDLSFVLTDLSTDERTVFTDSTVYFEDGTVGLVYWAALRVRPGHTYRVEVQPQGSEIVTSAETTLPDQPMPTVELEVVKWVFTTVLYAWQKIIWEGISEEPFAVEVWYRFFRLSDFGFLDVKLPYEPLHSRMGSDTWMMDLDLVRDRDSLAKKIDLNPSIRLAGIGMTVTLLDDAFKPPGGIFDPEVLAQPGTFSNVTNGFGFLGSVGRYSVEWLIADTTARALGYIPMEGASFRVPDQRAR